MSGIPADLFKQLREALLDCGPCGNYNQLQAVFQVYAELSPFRHSIPQAPDPAAQVNAVIAYLVDRQRADTKENALILLLRVLSEQIDPGAECHHRLARLAEELGQVLGDGSSCGSSSVDDQPPTVKVQVVVKIEKLVREDQLAEALEMLSSIEAYRNEATLLAGRLNRVRKQERQGLIAYSVANAERVKIGKAILDLVSS